MVCTNSTTSTSPPDLRRGELLGLKWTDVDFDRGVLKIQRAISRQNGKVVEAPLKTKNAYRTLPLSADAIDVLKAQKNKAGSSEWVFPSPTGGPMSPDSVLHMLHRVLKRAGLPRIRFHDLRHTFATMALQNGVDVKTVSSVCSVTTPRASRWTPTPTSPPTHSSRRRKRWGASSPVRYRRFPLSAPVGVSVWVRKKQRARKQQLMTKQKDLETVRFRGLFGTP